MLSPLLQRVRDLGPGLILAAAGIGAGDVIVASVTGIKFGPALLWGIVFTVTLKFVLTEALARWQLATGETIARAWVTRLPRWVSVLLGAYLLLWTFLVGAALSGACGLAGATLFPQLSTAQWGAIHALFAGALVASDRYKSFQRVMKILIAAMAFCVFACAILTKPELPPILRGLFFPTIPPGGGPAVLSLLGGIGGSVTVVCYAYLLRAQGWSGAAKLPVIRADVRLAYIFTGLFGIALCVIAAGVHAEGAAGNRIALEIGARLAQTVGPAARWIFLCGFWCTVFTAMLAVWQGVPHIYVDLIKAWRGEPAVPTTSADDPATLATLRRDRRIRLGALFLLAVPPLILLWHKQPVAVAVAFTIAGAFFMPFLASTLLYLNNRREWMGELANRRLGNIALIVCLLIFGAVCIREISEQIKALV